LRPVEAWLTSSAGFDQDHQDKTGIDKRSASIKGLHGGETSFPKLVAPILFIVAAVLPEVHFAADPILFYPFYPFLGFEPFVYHDKPWFVTPIGGVFAAIVWGSLIYLLSSIRRR
jgi:hypothetical protein